MSEARLPAGAIESALARLYPPENQYITDPVAWVQKKLNRYLWGKQVEILEAIRDNRMVAVHSAHGIGKSFTASCAGAWWLDVHPLSQAFLVTTAPSWAQVEAILWREIRRRHREAGLQGRITLDCKWHIGAEGTKRADSSEEIVALGRKPADYDEDTFQGIHARYFMAILDEAGGIPESLWNSVLALATNENSRILAIGNPDDPNSRFAHHCRPGSGWKVIKVSVWDVFEALEKEDMPEEVIEGLVSRQWVEDRRKDWGEGSPIWVAKVNGEFPDVSDEYLISPALIERARQLSLPGLGDGRYGMDVARFGVDKSVVYRNRDGVVRLVDEWAKMDTMQSAGRMANILKSTPLKRVPANIDIIGLGAGVYDRLREQGYNVAPHQGSQRALNPAKFKNRRSEVWWTFKDLMDNDLIDLDPADDKLAAELGSIKWGTDSAGRIYVETKEDMMERGLPSPNHADAAIMSTVSAGAFVIRNDDLRPRVTSDLLTKVM